MAIDFDRVGAECPGAVGIGRTVPAQIGLAALTEAVHIQNRD